MLFRAKGPLANQLRRESTQRIVGEGAVRLERRRSPQETGHLAQQGRRVQPGVAEPLRLGEAPFPNGSAGYHILGASHEPGERHFDGPVADFAQGPSCYKTNNELRHETEDPRFLGYAVGPRRVILRGHFRTVCGAATRQEDLLLYSRCASSRFASTIPDSSRRW